MSIWKKLAEYKLVRKIVYAIVGIFSYPGIAIINKKMSFFTLFKGRNIINNDSSSNVM